MSKIKNNKYLIEKVYSADGFESIIDKATSLKEAFDKIKKITTEYQNNLAEVEKDYPNDTYQYLWVILAHCYKIRTLNGNKQWVFSPTGRYVDNAEKGVFNEQD